MPAWINIEGKKKLYPMPNAANFCIGRVDDCDLCLDDPKASRNHALIQHMGDDTYYLIDIASRNGCYINSKRINSPKILKNRDKIRIGDTMLEFTLESGLRRRPNPNDTIISLPKHFELDIQEITILVADIRSFTTMTEVLPITSLSIIMNHWFTEVTECIRENNGILDKFIGDSVYARWNTQNSHADPVTFALKTACQLNRISKAMNEQFDEIPFPLKIGVGINTGHAALDIGAENTAIGDAVNLAFRLEDQSKIIGKDIVLSHESYRMLSISAWDGYKRPITVKGKKEIIDIIGIDFGQAESFLKRLRGYKP